MTQQAIDVAIEQRLSVRLTTMYNVHDAATDVCRLSRKVYKCSLLIVGELMFCNRSCVRLCEQIL